jgi:hypothetical protein
MQTALNCILLEKELCKDEESNRVETVKKNDTRGIPRTELRDGELLSHQYHPEDVSGSTLACLKTVLQMTGGAKESNKKWPNTGKNNEPRSGVKPHIPQTNSSQQHYHKNYFYSGKF